MNNYKELIVKYCKKWWINYTTTNFNKKFKGDCEEIDWKKISHNLYQYIDVKESGNFIKKYEKKIYLKLLLKNNKILESIIIYFDGIKNYDGKIIFNISKTQKEKEKTLEKLIKKGKIYHLQNLHKYTLSEKFILKYGNKNDFKIIKKSIKIWSENYILGETHMMKNIEILGYRKYTTNFLKEYLRINYKSFKLGEINTRDFFNKIVFMIIEQYITEDLIKYAKSLCWEFILGEDVRERIQNLLEKYQNL